MQGGSIKPIAAPPVILVESLLDAEDVDISVDSKIAAQEEAEDDLYILKHCSEAKRFSENSSFSGYSSAYSTINSIVPHCLSEAYTLSKQQPHNGVLRHVIVLMDASERMLETDYKPDRFRCCLAVLENFIVDFFKLNPLSQLGLVIMTQHTTMTVAMLSSDEKSQIDGLRQLNQHVVTGNATSLVLGLERAMGLLLKTPHYGTKEIIVFFGGIHTADNSNIMDTLDQLKQERVRVSIISLSPELYIFKKICGETNGLFFVTQSKDDLMQATEYLLESPTWTKKDEVCLVPIAFARLVVNANPSLCICHNRLSLDGYICPRCHSKVCLVPTRCVVCQLHLAKTADISRISQHLVVLPELIPTASSESQVCQLCELPVEWSENGYYCEGCSEFFCSVCAAYRCTVLKQCPTCIRNKLLSR